MDGELLIYGSYGYQGALIARRALDEGLEPILAGRDPGRVEEQATEFDLEHRVFSLDHPEIVEREVADCDAVLNCAGPFTETVAPLVNACLRTGTDYLDIAGNVDVLEWVAALDAEASNAPVALVPGVGFDVVPTDCLAATLHGAAPKADHLTLALDGLGTFSPGTVKSIVEGMRRPGAVRRNEVIETVPMAWKRRSFDFPTGRKAGVTVPWGEISTAYYTTGIPNIEIYATVPPYAATIMQRSRPLAPLLGSAPVRKGFQWLADAMVSGPTAAERAQSVTHIWGEVVDENGDRIEGRLRTPDTYDVTAHTAVEAARRVMDGDVGGGFQTPASAFGPDFILDFEGVEREIMDGRETVERGQQ